MKTRAWLAALSGRAGWPLLAALWLLVAAVSMPPLRLPRDTFRYLITFDVTQSMNVEDMGRGAVSRLAYARATVREALRRLPCGSRVGWAVFADYRALALLAPVEVCANYDILLSSLDGIDSRMAWTNASNITKGLYWTLRVTKDIGADTRVVFITDGHEAPPLRPSEHSMQHATPGEVGGWIVGVGGDTPAPIPRTDRDGMRMGYWSAADVVQPDAVSPSAVAGQGQEHLSALHEAHLVSLARQTGLGYHRLSTAAALSGALLDGRLSHRERVATDLRALPAALALLLLVCQFLPDTGQVRRWRRG